MLFPQPANLKSQMSSTNSFYECILYVLLTTGFCVYAIIDFFHPTFQSVSELIINKQNTMKRADVNEGLMAATYNGISAREYNKRLFFYPVDIVMAILKYYNLAK